MLGMLTGMRQVKSFRHPQCLTEIAPTWLYGRGQALSTPLHQLPFVPPLRNPSRESFGKAVSNVINSVSLFLFQLKKEVVEKQRMIDGVMDLVRQVITMANEYRGFFWSVPTTARDRIYNRGEIFHLFNQCTLFSLFFLTFPFLPYLFITPKFFFFSLTAKKRKLEHD